VALSERSTILECLEKVREYGHGAHSVVDDKNRWICILHALKHLLFTLWGEGMSKDERVKVEASVKHALKSSDPEAPKGEVDIDCKGKLVIPGLISVHTHAYSVLVRGVMNTLWGVTPTSNFVETLQRIWWPIVEDNISKKEVYIGTLLACIEMLKSGITCFLDFLEAPNALPGCLNETERAVREAGIRAFLGFEASDRAGLSKRELGFSENLSCVVRNKSDPLVKGIFALHAPFSCSRELLLKTKEAALKHEALISIHLAQDRLEDELSKRENGVEAVEYLNNIGFLGPNVIGAHCVHFSEKAIIAFARSGAAVAHNPISNMMAAFGQAPVPKLLQLNVRVGLGNDGVASYKLDMFDVMKATSMLHKVSTHNPAIISDSKIFEMATLEGAKALKMENRIGSIEENKQADIVVIDLNSPHLVPWRDPFELLVNNICGRDVDTVIVNGKVRVHGGKVIGIDEGALIENAQRVATALWDKMFGETSDKYNRAIHMKMT
jgi:cytosine/adenosine deaminase-related metal-dependent hydrolase